MLNGTWIMASARIQSVNAKAPTNHAQPSVHGNTPPSLDAAPRNGTASSNASPAAHTRPLPRNNIVTSMAGS